MDKYQKRKLFNQTLDCTKEQILQRINENLEEFENPDGSLAADIDRERIIEFCKEFKEQVEEKMLPSLIDDWLYYDIAVQPDGIELGIWNCEEINFDSDGEISDMCCEREFVVLKTKYKYLTIPEYAQKVKVKEKTVKGWIRRGKIRYGMKKDGDWYIPELVEKPGRKYRPVIYRWESDQLLGGISNIDLKNSKGIYLHQGENGEIAGSVFRENGMMEIRLNRKECERLEYQLIQNSKVEVEELEERFIFMQSSRRLEMNSHLDKMFRKLKQVEKGEKEAREEEQVLDYGPIVVRKGKYKGRIGYYDNDMTDAKAIVYFGDMFTTNRYYEIPHRNLSNDITVSELVERLLVLNAEIAKISLKNIYPQRHIDYLAECLMAERLLTEKYHSAMWETPTKELKLFVACNSEDLTFARCLVTDLLNVGYQVFFADWSLKLGDNILKRINEELENADVFIPVISENFNTSSYCMMEFHSFLAKNMREESCKIMPVIIDDSKLDILQGIYKYYQTDGFMGYAKYIRELLKALSNS